MYWKWVYSHTHTLNAITMKTITGKIIAQLKNIYSKCWYSLLYVNGVQVNVKHVFKQHIYFITEVDYIRWAHKMKILEMLLKIYTNFCETVLVYICCLYFVHIILTHSFHWNDFRYIL